MQNIHASSIVEDGAKIGDNTTIGPFCHIGPNVKLGDGCVLHSHVSIQGNTTIGDNCIFFPTAIIGGPPQNGGHKGGFSELKIGNHCTFREGVTAHLGTDTARALTNIGDHGMFLANSHIAHDCSLGDHVTLANGALLAGHVEIGSHVIMGGGAAVHQFVRVGHHAFIGGLAGITADLIPFGMAIGNRADLSGLNIIGLRRSGLARSDIHALRRSYKRVFDKELGNLNENVEAMNAEDNPAIVQDLLDFLSTSEKRSYLVPPLKGRAGTDG